MSTSPDNTERIPEMNSRTAFSNSTDDTMDEADIVQARNQAMVDAMLGRTSTRPPPPAPYPGVYVWYETFNKKVVEEAINQTVTKEELEELMSGVVGNSGKEKEKCSKMKTTDEVELESAPVVVEDTCPRDGERTGSGIRKACGGCELDHLETLVKVLDVKDAEMPDSGNVDSSRGLKDGLTFDLENCNDTNRYWEPILKVVKTEEKDTFINETVVEIDPGV
ncbi:hypothetical protein BZA77DRAFT_294121 [Pyronema omphalodes]|nr:hypothetical protein BZA77DRAFT_294121 [Pyronema omphalodes]